MTAHGSDDMACRFPESLSEAQISEINERAIPINKKKATKLGFSVFQYNILLLPYLPVYNAHPFIMRTPILKPVFREKKKAFQCHSCRKIIFWKNSTEMSNLALPARKSVTGVDANHLIFCLFSDTSSFMMFSSFSAAVLLMHDRTRSICTTTVTFL